MFYEAIEGHQAVIERLERCVREQSVPHALIFSGPPGVGKAMAAKAFVKHIFSCYEENSQKAANPNTYKRIDEKIHPDVHFIRPNEKNHILIGDIRRLIASVTLKPYESSLRAVIIDQAQTMNFDAQNAFLKILEEPPKNVYFVLIVNELGHLLATVKSRCQRLAFRHLSQDSILKILARKDIHHPDAERMAEHLRGSLERMDDIARITELREVFWSYLETAREGLPDWSRQDRDALMLFLDVATEVIRDILCVAAGCGRGLLVHSEKERCHEQASRMGFARAEKMLNRVAQARQDITHSVNTRLIGTQLWMEFGA